MSHLVHADAVTACDLARKTRITFDLVYLDPPYGVGTVMTARTRKGETRGARQRSGGPDAYDDSRSIPELVAMLTEACAAIGRRMSERCTLVVHLDHRAVHDVKVALDGVFGRGAFLGEIVWVPGNGGRGARFSVTHQTLLLYARDPRSRGKTTFDASHPEMREPYAGTSLSMHFDKVDGDGRRYRERTLGGKTYRYYADRGKKRSSVWTDIPAMVANTPLQREGTGYPTQKPLRLLERLVLGFSGEGDVVADLMCGSGTTLVAASRHGRRFFGGDESQRAITVAEARLAAEGLPFRRIV